MLFSDWLCCSPSYLVCLKIQLFRVAFSLSLKLSIQKREGEKTCPACSPIGVWAGIYTAISRKVVGKSARGNPERHCGWFWVHCSSKKFERIGTKGHENVFLSVKGKQQKYVRQLKCIDHIPYYLSGLSRAHFSDNLSRNSCKHWSTVAFWPLQFVFFKNTSENWFICRLNNSCKLFENFESSPMCCVQ